jgi:hypothetical protein
MYDVMGMFKQFFAWRKLVNDGDSRMSIHAIEDLERLQKACNVAEDIIRVTDEYVLQMSEKDFKKYNKLVVKFQKLD